MFLKYNFYTFFWLICMFALNLGRLESLPELRLFYFLYFDKFAHFIQFCILSFLMLVGLYKQQTFVWLRFNATRVTLFACLIYSLLLEGIHFFIAKQYFETWDLLANIFGTLGGILVFYLIYVYKNEQ